VVPPHAAALLRGADLGHGPHPTHLFLGGVVLDDGDLGLPHGGLGGQVVRVGDQVRRLDDRGVRMGVRAVLRQVAADPPVRAEAEQQQPHADGEHDVAHPEGQQVEGGAEQRQVDQRGEQEQPAEDDHDGRRRARTPRRGAEQAGGDHQRQGRQQAVGGQAEVALPGGGEEADAARGTEEAEGEEEQSDADRSQLLDGEDPRAGRRLLSRIDRRSGDRCPRAPAESDERAGGVGEAAEQGHGVLRALIGRG
jgi:hypothetical protein